MAWDVMSGVTKKAWDVMSGVTKTAWDVLSGVANLCGMFCPGCKKMAWDVLSRDVLSGSHLAGKALDWGHDLYTSLTGDRKEYSPVTWQDSDTLSAAMRREIIPT